MTAPEVRKDPPVRVNAPVIRFALRVLGWSQAELARRLDVHESTVSRILDGAATTHVVGAKLCQVFPALGFNELIHVEGFPIDLPAGATDQPVT